MSPRAKAGAFDASRPPWEASLQGGPGILDTKKDRKTNAEITPLEVAVKWSISVLHALSESRSLCFDIKIVISSKDSARTQEAAH